MATYTAGETLTDPTYGDITILEAHEATENSPEQYTVQQWWTGGIVRTPLPDGLTDATPAAEPEAEAATGDAQAEL